jgi:hypothetical protein
VSVVAPPPSPQRPDDLEALIREARARQKRRWLGVAAIVAVLAGAALGLNSIVTKGRPGASAGGGGPNPAVRSGGACGVRIDNMRIVDSGGNTLYREPGDWTPSYPHPSVVRCSGASVWVVWDNGGAMNQEGYVGVRSADAGRTWHLVFADSFFGVDAPHQIGPDLGPWSLGGPQAAYFTSWCPVCSPDMPKAFALWVTKDGGRTFRMYDIRGLGEYEPVGLRVAGRTATITAKGFIRGTQRRRTVTIHIA